MLLELPPEIIESILVLLDPISVARFSEICQSFFSLIYAADNKQLWRSLFLQDDQFDGPRKCVNSFGQPLLSKGEEFDWRNELKRRIRAETVIRNPACCRSDAELLEVLDTLISMVVHTPVASYQYNTHDISRNLVWLVGRRKLGDFIEGLHARATDLSHEIFQRVTQLHTFMGCTVDDFLLPRRVKTRAFVYDFDNYHDGNNWGPFDTEGKVNWEHLLAIQNVMAMHVVAPEILLEEPNSEGHHVLSLLPYCQAQLPSRRIEEDWAAVEGIWSCHFCFIDHRELLAYNATNPRDVSPFKRPDFIEVFRSFRLIIHFAGTRPNPRHPTRPTILFRGGIEDAHTISGTVRGADDGTVRWSFVSGEATQMIWSSEGVQIGVAQSTFRVLGSWTTVFHEEGDPVGPFWLRKEIDEEEGP